MTARKKNCFSGTIRPAQESDLPEVAKIWLDANISAHAFIPASYWQERFPMIEPLLAQADIILYETQGEILGFLGSSGNYIEGIFVRADARSHGIGKSLIKYAQKRHSELALSVYQKNTDAVRFYQREGFRISEAGIDPDSGEAEYHMVWYRVRPAAGKQQNL